MRKLILIKLGGSVITDKSKPFTAKIGVIKRLALEIKKAKSKVKNTDFIIGHGGGSFPHVPAAKYQTQKGNTNKNSLIGFCLTADAAIDINRIAIKEFLKAGLPVASFAPLSFLFAKKQRMYKAMLNHIMKCFDIDIIPVIYGDVIMDEEMGFCIFSAEKTLGILARKLKNSYETVKVIECGDTDGVYDSEGKTIPEINPENFKEVKKCISGSKSTDVTGGMIHKVEESLRLAKETKTQTLLINGNKAGNLQKAISGKETNSTVIKY